MAKCETCSLPQFLTLILRTHVARPGWWAPTRPPSGAPRGSAPNGALLTGPTRSSAPQIGRVPSAADSPPRNHHHAERKVRSANIQLLLLPVPIFPQAVELRHALADTQPDTPRVEWDRHR